MVDASDQKEVMKQESLDEAMVRIQRKFCIPSKKKQVEAVIPAPEVQPQPPEVQGNPEEKEPPTTSERLMEVRKYPQVVLDRQKKFREELGKHPERFGVSKERIRLVEKLIEIQEHPEKYGSKAEQKRASERILGRLMGKSATSVEKEQDEEE